jgi:hypothetical protein
VLELGRVDLDEIAQALSDQTDNEHQWMLDPATGELHIWTSDTGLDGQDLMDTDELEDADLIAIDPLPSHVWYADMADFAERISDEHASRRLARAIRGRGAFRRFKDELYEEYPDLVSEWHVPRRPRPATSSGVAARRGAHRGHGGRAPSEGSSRSGAALTASTGPGLQRGFSGRWSRLTPRRHVLSTRSPTPVSQRDQS